MRGSLFGFRGSDSWEYRIRSVLLSMLQRMWKGSLCCKVEGDNIVCFLNQCKRRKVPVYHISSMPEYTIIEVEKKQYNMVSFLASKVNVRVVPFEKRGLPFLMQRMLSFYLLCIGLLLCIVMLLFQREFIWSVTIQGNSSIKAETIMVELEQLGVYPGCLKHGLDFSNLEQMIRLRIPSLQWVSCAEDGCRLILSVKERYEETFTEAKDEQMLVAPREGIVEKMIVRSGTAMVRTGDYVSQSQPLIVNTIGPVTSDEFETVEAIEGAQGYVVLRETIQESIPLNSYVSIWVKPAWWQEDSWICEKKKKSNLQMEKESLEKINDFLDLYRKKGIQILEKNVKILRTVDLWQIKVTISVLEKVETDYEYE